MVDTGPGEPGWSSIDEGRAMRDRFDGVFLAAAVHVETEHGDPELSGVVEDQSLGIHARVVGEHTGQEGRRPVGLEPGRLIGRQRERGRMRLAEPEGGKGLQDLPDLLGDPGRIATGQAAREEPRTEERSGGKESVSTCGSRWSRDNKKKKQQSNNQ